MQNDNFYDIKDRVYLDNNATTFPSVGLRERWGELIEVSGNPSSIHAFGRKPKNIVRDSKAKLSKFLNCSPSEIIFNSGASEGNSTIFRSVWSSLRKNRNEFIVSKVEHPSVLKVCSYLEQNGAKIFYLDVDRGGQLNLDQLKRYLSERTALVSCMFANNETGVIYPIKEISELAHQAGALMHADCVQTIGKIEFDYSELNLDYATFSAHKFYALKGTGFCIVKPNAPWEPLVFGSQERGRRGGTENILGIAGLNIVMDEVVDIKSRIQEMKRLRDLFESKVVSTIPGVTITASKSPRLPNTSNIMITGVDGDTLLMSLDLKGFAVSTGAACSSGSPDPSPVLIAMGFSKSEAQSSLRISLGWYSKESEILNFIDVLGNTISKLRELAPENFEKILRGKI